MTQKRAHLWISGLVQGVFFRARTKDQACLRGLTGWVRNMPDGRVETVFEGADKAVEEMIEWCRHGPQGAIVRDVDLKWEEPASEVSGFEIRH